MVVDPARLSQYRYRLCAHCDTHRSCLTVRRVRRVLCALCSGLSRKFAWHAVTGVRLVANDDGLHPTPSSGDAQATAGGATTTAADTTAAYSTADTNTAWLFVGCNNEVRCLAMAGCGWAHGVRRASAGDPDAVRQAGRVTRKRGRANNVAGDGGTRQRRARKRKRRPGPAPSLNSADGAAVDAVARAGAGAGAGAGSGSGSGSGVGKLPSAAKDVLLKWLAKRDDIDALWKQFHVRGAAFQCCVAVGMAQSWCCVKLHDAACSVCVHVAVHRVRGQDPGDDLGRSRINSRCAR